MPRVFNLSVDEAVKEAREAHGLGVPAVILFGLPEKKDELASGAWADDGIVQQATQALKREVPGLIVMGDVCLCEYMSHGHCGDCELEFPLAKPRLPAARDQVVDSKTPTHAKTGQKSGIQADTRMLITRSITMLRWSCWLGLRFRWRGLV